MKIRNLFAVAAATMLSSLAMTSCLGDGKDDSMKVQTTYSSFFNAIQVPLSGEYELYPGVSYTLETELSNSTANLKIEGLKLPDGSSYPSMIFQDVTWKTNARGWTEINLTNAVPDGVGGYMMVPTFSTLNFQTVNRYIDNLFVPCVSIRYDVNGYRVYSFPEQILEIGKTTVENKTTGTLYKPEESNVDPAVYVFTLSPTKQTVTVTISGAKFHQDMPAMNMRFADIPFEIDHEGNIVMEKESLIPSLLTGATLATSTATPMPSFPITDFKAKYDPDRGLWVSYVCSPDMEKFKGVFSVSMVNEYPDNVNGGSSAN